MSPAPQGVLVKINYDLKRTPAPQRVLIKINYDLKSSANVSRLCGIFIYLFKFSKMKEGYVVRDQLRKEF